MIKKLLIAMIAMSIVVLLVLLVRESRSVSAQFYIDYSSYASSLRQAQRDHETLSDTLTTVSSQALGVPNTVETLTGRLAQSKTVLQSPPETIESGQVRSAAARYVSSVNMVLAAVERFTEAENALAVAAEQLRDDAPQIVRQLRDRGNDELSQTLFGLTVEFLDNATGKTDTPVGELGRRLDEVVAMAEDAGADSPGFVAIIDAAASTPVSRAKAVAELQAFENASLTSSAQGLYSAIAAMNASVTSRADRARILLGGVSAMLILGIALIGVRLRQSNQALNETNAELEQFNVSLEERVSERTRELSKAYEELQESQAQLVQAEKMSSLGELVAGISHEINTPLWYLLSNTTLIKERLGSFTSFVGVADDMLSMLRAGGNDKASFIQQLRRLDKALTDDGLRDDLQESNDLLDDSVEGLEQLSEMAQSLKDFSRLDRASTDKVNLNDGVERTLVIAKNVLKGGIEVNRNLGELPEVSCSPGQINQVLLNLIKNASDAMDRKGTLSIGTWADDEFVHVSVKDTGMGMDEETLAKVRDPFFTTKEVGKGTGLGLSISQKIIDAHDGKLEIQSSLGKGSTFIVSLPLTDNSQQSDMERELEELENFTGDFSGGDAEDSSGDEMDLVFAAEKTG
ncbi:MAG: sensor histidine kinase [Woeseiaceae bacterium]